MTPHQKKERTKRIAAIHKRLTKEFGAPKIALRYTTDYELLIAVILSAQCTDVRVNMVTEQLFKKYTTINDYADADQAEFEQDIYQTGFYRAKAKNIITTAKKIRDDFGGAVPRTMEELLTLPGVARKTANVVLSNAFGVNEGIAVDTHVRRFAIRFDLSDYTDPVRIERDLMEIVPRQNWNTITYLLIEYGREICPARKHDCTDHPLTTIYPPAADVWPKAK